MKTKTKELGQPSWRIATRHVEASVTETGGHVGPVTFRIGRKKVRPLSVADLVFGLLEVAILVEIRTAALPNNETRRQNQRARR